MREMDSCISSIFLQEDQDAFSQLFNLILNEGVEGMKVAAHLLCYHMSHQEHVFHP